MRIGRFRTPRGRPLEVLGLASVITLLLSLLAGAVPAPAKPAGGRPPALNAATWLLIDGTDREVLAARDPDQRRAIASTTKLMTAYLALNELRLDEKLEVPAYSAAPAESVVGLSEGERLTVRDLLVAMLLPSANDAAETVALGVAGSERAFVAEMNRAAADLDLTGTSYANPIGLDQRGNYSTATDLSELALELLADKRFRRIVSKPEATLTSGSQDRVVANTNTLLLADPSVDGVKTGHTLDAGYVLVASAKRDGVPLVAAVLGAPSEADRDVETEELLDYGFSLYDERNAVGKGEQMATSAVRYADQPLPLIAQRSVGVSIREDQRLAIDVEGPTEVEGPISGGDQLGRATVSVDGRFIGRTPLLAARDVDEPTVIDRIGGPVVAAAIVIAVIVILAAVAFLLRRRNDESRDTGRDPEERMKTRQDRIRRRQGQGEGEGE